MKPSHSEHCIKINDPLYAEKYTQFLTILLVHVMQLVVMVDCTSTFNSSQGNFINFVVDDGHHCIAGKQVSLLMHVFPAVVVCVVFSWPDKQKQIQKLLSTLEQWGHNSPRLFCRDTRVRMESCVPRCTERKPLHWSKTVLLLATAVRVRVHQYESLWLYTASRHVQLWIFV